VNAISPTSRRLAWRLGLWGLASWLILRLHDAPFAGEHSICGPWGCGPTISALLAAHGFWLITLVPLAYWARSTLSASHAIVLGRILSGLSAGGIASVAAWELTHWPTTDHPGLRAYAVQHGLFALATLVEVPLTQGMIAGLILARTTRRGAPDGAVEGCGDESCGLLGSTEGVGPAPDRIEVGQPFPRRSFVVPGEKPIVIPDDNTGRRTVLYFMRATGCSICRGHVRRLAEKRIEIDALEADVFIVHPGDSRASRALEKSLDLRFPIIASRDSEILGSKARRLMGLRMCGTLIIDGRGMIRSVRLSRLPHGGFHEAQLMTFLHRIKDEIPSVHNPSAVTPV
jgi:peroxiredoxin